MDSKGKLKFLTILLLILSVTMVFALVACGDGDTQGATDGTGSGTGDGKSWPSVSYLTEAEKYIGAGEIAHVNSWADGSNGIYINNATEAAVSAYRTQLENAGWTLDVGPVNNADNTAWGYVNGEETCSIRLYSAVQTEERSSEDYSYNLYIGFANDGVALPAENALSVPVVSVNGSGLASWSAVTNANGYKYKISGGAEQATQSTSVQLTNGQSIQVKAVGDGTNHTDSAYSPAKSYTAGGGGSATVTVGDFDYQLGNNYYISSRWDVTGFDNNDNEYVYQEYRKVAFIGDVYFIEKYDFNYEKSNAQGNFSQVFYVPNGSEYKKYSRSDANEAFELRNTDTLSVEVSPAIALALGETAITRANTYIISSTLQYVTAGATSTHEATGRTVKKYTYGTSGTPMYDFYVDIQTKICLKFDDHINDGHINLSICSTSGNAWGSNGLPALPSGETPEPTALAVPVVTINQSGLASWAAVANASGYKIKINGGTEEIADGLNEQLSNGDTIQVKAVGDGETYSDSAFSAIQTYTAQGEPQPTVLATPTVSINETGLASWAAVTNASGYKYMINFGTEQTAPANRQVQLINGQSIIVKAVGDGETYSDSAYSESETYTEVVATNTWPTATKLTEYGYNGLTQPTGSTISLVGETVATEDEPATLTIVISNGTGEMFDNITTSLFSFGAINGINEESGTTFAADEKADLIRLIETYGSAFMGLKATDTENVYDAVNVEYYASAGLDDVGDAIAAQTFIISFAKVDLSASSADPSFADYITLPQKFTLTYSETDGETRTVIKDGDKLWYHIYSEYEDRECLAIKQSDDTYITYEKDNKVGSGRWGTDPMSDTITYSDDAISALGGFEPDLLLYAQCKVNGDVFETGAATTVANMTCNVYTKESSGYTDTYYTYNGLTFKYTERYEQDEPSVNFVVLTYSATGDLSDAKYSID